MKFLGEDIDKIDKICLLFIGIWLTLCLLTTDIIMTTFFGYPSPEQDSYTDGEIQELSGFIREDGINLPPISTMITEKNISLKDKNTFYSPCAWATSDGIVWIKSECKNSYYVIGHEMAHHVLYITDPNTSENHHNMLKFRQWEACLGLSAKFHVNLCKVMQ